MSYTIEGKFVLEVKRKIKPITCEVKLNKDVNVEDIYDVLKTVFAAIDSEIGGETK